MITSAKKLSSVLSAFVIALSLVLLAPLSTLADQPEEPQQEETPTFAFPDEQLINFFDTNRELSELNKETQNKMAEAAQQHGLTLERFNQIAKANQIGALQGGAFTDEEVQAFIDLGPKISQIQREHQAAIQEKLQERGFTPQSYQDILSEYRKDQELQAHVRELLRERRKQEILEERRREAEEKAKEEEANS
ncbi:MAG: DUF4168 domain-containing protein [Bacteroidota bacterium]